MSEPEHYYEFAELCQQEIAQYVETYQIEGEFQVVQHFIDHIKYNWDLDHDYS